MNPNFAGSGNHWRVLPQRSPFDGLRTWIVWRRHWDRWEQIGMPYLSRRAALTDAHHLARRGRHG